MNKNNKELKAYENIIQNLWALKEETAKTRPGEAKAIEAVVQSLFNLNDSLQLDKHGIHQASEAGLAQDNGRSKILVHAH